MAFENEEDRISMSHEINYALIDVDGDLYHIRSLAVLDDGIWKNLMTQPFLMDTCVNVVQMT